MGLMDMIRSGQMAGFVEALRTRSVVAHLDTARLFPAPARPPAQRRARGMRKQARLRRAMAKAWRAQTIVIPKLGEPATDYWIGA